MVTILEGNRMQRLLTLLVLLGIAFTTSACIVEEPGRACTYWHPCR
jgi:hypothetical protein